MFWQHLCTQIVTNVSLCLGQPEARDWWPCSLKLDQLCEINQWKLPWQRKQGRLFLKRVVYCHFILECFTAGGAESLWQFIHVPRQFQSHTRRITNGALRTDPADTRRHMSRKHKSHRHSTTSWIKSEMNLFRQHMWGQEQSVSAAGWHCLLQPPLLTILT